MLENYHVHTIRCDRPQCHDGDINNLADKEIERLRSDNERLASAVGEHLSRRIVLTGLLREAQERICEGQRFDKGDLLWRINDALGAK